MLTYLADIARTSGLPVVEMEGWQSRGHGEMTDVLGVVLHHTAGAVVGDFPSEAILRDGRPDLEGPLANFALTRSGTVVVIAAGKAYHAGAGSGFGLPDDGANGLMLGIEAESTGSVEGDWTFAQIDAYPRLVAALVAGFGFDVDMVIGHKEWAPGRKVDPRGWPGDLDGFRASVTEALAGEFHPFPDGVPAGTLGAHTGKLTADGSYELVLTGVRSPLTVARWQQVMGTLVDGSISRPPAGANPLLYLMGKDQAYLNSVVSAEQIRALTSKDQLDVDAIEGKGTISVRQYWLFTSWAVEVLGREPKPSDYDGIIGPDTNRLHQHALNLATAGTGRY